jgi:hypothetical protein
MAGGVLFHGRRQLAAAITAADVITYDTHNTDCLLKC